MPLEITKAFQSWRFHFLTEPNKELSQQSEREFIAICGKHSLDYRSVRKHCREWYRSNHLGYVANDEDDADEAFND